MQELDVFKKMQELANLPLLPEQEESAKKRAIAKHKEWLRTLDRETPNIYAHMKVGIYIRYYNQTKYEDYLAYHKRQFRDTVDMCPNWTLVDFYIDEGNNAPNMESSPAWTRLLNDCIEGKIDLILTQKVSNVSKKPEEVAFCSRILAAHNVGIYFISEDIYTMASYYQEDLHDPFFFPTPDWTPLPDNSDEEGLLHD